VARHVFLAWSNPVAGREDEFEQWYDQDHLDEVLATPGFVSAQRYQLAPVQREGQTAPPTWQTLVIYEVEGDIDRIHEILAERAHLRSFSTACADDHAAWVYSPVGAPRVASPD
jgi:hypothetical protein